MATPVLDPVGTECSSLRFRIRWSRKPLGIRDVPSDARGETSGQAEFRGNAWRFRHTRSRFGPPSRVSAPVPASVRDVGRVMRHPSKRLSWCDGRPQAAYVCTAAPRILPLMPLSNAADSAKMTMRGRNALGEMPPTLKSRERNQVDRRRSTRSQPTD